MHDTRVDSTLTRSATADAETRLSREFLKADEAGLSARDTPQELLVFPNTQSANETTSKEVNQQYPMPSHSHAELTDGQAETSGVTSGAGTTSLHSRGA